MKLTIQLMYAPWWLQVRHDVHLLPFQQLLINIRWFVKKMTLLRMTPLTPPLRQKKTWSGAIAWSSLYIILQQQEWSTVCIDMFFYAMLPGLRSLHFQIFLMSIKWGIYHLIYPIFSCTWHSIGMIYHQHRIWCTSLQMSSSIQQLRAGTQRGWDVLFLFLLCWQDINYFELLMYFSIPNLCKIRPWFGWMTIWFDRMIANQFNSVMVILCVLRCHHLWQLSAMCRHAALLDYYRWESMQMTWKRFIGFLTLTTIWIQCPHNDIWSLQMISGFRQRHLHLWTLWFKFDLSWRLQHNLDNIIARMIRLRDVTMIPAQICIGHAWQHHLYLWTMISQLIYFSGGPCLFS